MACRLARLDDRMTTSDNMDTVALIQYWATVVLVCRDVGETLVNVEFGQRVGGIQNALSGVDCDISAQLDEELILHFVDTILGIEDQGLILF